MDIIFQSPFPAIFTFLIFIIITVPLIITWQKSKPTKSVVPKLPPGPWRLPLIGNLHNLISSLPHHRFRDLANIYGPLMYLRIGEVPHVIVSSPEMAKEITRTHDANFAQRPRILLAGKYYGLDIVFGYGEYWRMLKKTCVEELLSHKRVQSFRSIREEEVLNIVQEVRLSSGVPINLTEKIFSMMYEITSTAAFGKKCKDQELFISSVDALLKLAGRGFAACDMFPSHKWLHWIGDIRPEFEKTMETLDNIVDGIIAEHKAEKKTSETLSNGRSGCLLDVLLTLQDNPNLKFSLEMDNIKAVLLDMFVAGSESVATLIEWAMLEMMKNPRIMEKAQNEVRQVFREQGNVDEAGLHELKFLKMIIKETLRFHPPGPFIIPREAKESCVVNGYYIPAKTVVIINGWAIGRDPRYWNDPETFYPERFKDSSVDFRGTNYEFIPFGAGRRICPGISYAVVDSELALAQLLFHFDWKLADGITHETLDMSEGFATTVRRKEDLHLIPIPYNPKLIR